MIFADGYDTSLYYMLKGNNFDKIKILKFIKDLPDELINNIQIETHDYLNNKDIVGKKDQTFYNIYSVKYPNIKYKFKINCGDLYIDKINVNNGKDKVLSSISLHYFKREYLKNIYSEYGMSLGIFSTGTYPTLNYVENDYYMVNTKFGPMICFHYCFFCNFVELKFYQPIRIKNETVEMFRTRKPKINSLSNKKS